MSETPWKRWVWALVAGLALANAAAAADVDADGLSDEWESFYWDLSLRPNQDPDQDNLQNSEEAVLLSDPLDADTDHDGLTDLEERANMEYAISRGYVRWGEGRFTHEDRYEGPAPGWVLEVWRENGAWITNETGQTGLPAIAPGATAGWQTTGLVGQLHLAIDRTVITNDLMLMVAYRDVGPGSFYVDISSTSGVVLLENVCGNLIQGSGADVRVVRPLPLEAAPEGWVIDLRATGSVGTVFETQIYSDLDQDGLDDMGEQMYGTNPRLSDSDGDGLTDGEEVLRYRTNPLSVDTDGDHMADEWEVRHGLNPLSDDRTGDLDHDGTSNYTEYLQGRDPNAGVVADNGQVRLKLFMPLR